MNEFVYPTPRAFDRGAGCLSSPLNQSHLVRLPGRTGTSLAASAEVTLLLLEKRNREMRMPRELFASLLLACSVLTGCQATFSGRVVDAETGTPIPSAWVWVQKTGDTGFPMYKPRCERLDIVRTDALGRFDVPVIPGAKTGVHAFASGYARDFRLAAVTEVNGRSFVESNARSVVSTPVIVKGNMTVVTPTSGPPTPQQLADAYPNLPPVTSADDGLPLYPLWPVHAGKPRRSGSGLPSSCGADPAAYAEATKELRDALQDCGAGCAR